jgi:hypothetical protein
MKTTITRAILNYIVALLGQATAVHVASLHQETGKAKAEAKRKFRYAEHVSDLAAAALESADIAEAKAEEKSRANEAEALRLLERV